MIDVGPMFRPDQRESAVNDGGPAFPCPMSEQSSVNQRCEPFQGGMTLRDYFASHATWQEIDCYTPLSTADCAAFLGMTVDEYTPHARSNYMKIVQEIKFMIADTMIAQRTKEPPCKT